MSKPTAKELLDYVTTLAQMMDDPQYKYPLRKTEFVLYMDWLDKTVIYSDDQSILMSAVCSRCKRTAYDFGDQWSLERCPHCGAVLKGGD